ncbi:putative elongation of very long chain fatty acids protein [Ochromonadaceae sp. CCMP2298]|nr:putative elongation of very long chain fatty acids protein [Ochromonadaceae sp. CCMP2298]
MTSYEQNFNPLPAVAFAANNWLVPIAIVTAYILFVFIVPSIMATRKPFDLEKPLAAWNGLLCVFSTIGLCKTVPVLLSTLYTDGYSSSVCSYPAETWGTGSSGLWVVLFIFSKIPELMDTVFIVLRKKPLVFLHWYHHVTVLLFCWSSLSTMAASGLYFVAMNYTAHSLMYGYYCLKALHICPKAFPTVLITLTQILQMVLGTCVCVSCWYYAVEGRACSNDRSNLIAGALMYGSYLYLFVDFFVRRYLLAPKKREKKV